MNKLLSLKTVREEHVPVSKSTLQKLTKSGRLKTVYVGRRVFVTEQALQDYLASLSGDPLVEEVQDSTAAVS